MTIEELQGLMTQFDDSSIRELQLTLEGVQLLLSKNETGVTSTSAATEKIATQNVVNPVIEPTTSESDLAPILPKEVLSEGKTIDSPIVGVIYTASEPGAPPFKKVGDKVEIGERLCIVEAMKIMNDITSDVSGTITEILINNEEVVDFGQPLFRVV